MPTPLQTGNQAVQNVTDNNPNATANTNASALSSGTAKDSQGGAITGFGSQNSTAPTVMSPTQAFNNTQIQVPTVTPPDTSGGILGGANQTLSQITASLTPSPTAAEGQQQSVLDSIASLTDQEGQKGADTAAAQNAAGVNQKQQDLLNATNELATKTASYNQLQASLGGNQGSETKAVLAAQNAGLTKAAAADIGVTNAKITAAQGNLSLAQQQVTDAINLKYSTIEAQIATKQAQLAALQPQLDKEQKTQALAQQVLLQQQAQQIQDAKDKETQINSIMLNAASAGADQATLNSIQNSPDILSAINAAAPALGAKVANDLKQQTFDNALKLRTAANDATRVAIEQENANISAGKLQLDAQKQASDQSNAAQAALNALVTTPSGKKYVDGTGLDAAGKQAALNAGQIVLSGPQQQSMTAITNVQGQLGTLLSTLQQNGVDLTKTTTSNGSLHNQGGTSGFMNYWAAGAASPAVDNFAANLKSIVTDLQKLPGTGQLVASLQNNVLSKKDDAKTMQTKITTITQALEDSENGLLVDNSPPAQMNYNGKILNLQADGTYQ